MRGDIKMKTNNFDLFEDLNLTEDERKVFDSRRETSTIIAKIIKRRMDLKMSQRDLAIKTGIKQPMIARIENGDSVPRIDTLIRIANELNLKIGFEKNDVIEFTQGISGKTIKLRAGESQKYPLTIQTHCEVDKVA